MLSVRRLLTNKSKLVINNVMQRHQHFRLSQAVTSANNLVLYRSVSLFKRSFSTFSSTQTTSSSNQNNQEETRNTTEEKEEEQQYEEPKRTVPSTKKIELVANIIFLSLVGVASYYGYQWYSSQDDPFGTIMAMFSLKKFSEPISEKLLPDFPENIPPQLRKPTLVICMEDFLTHTSWTPQHGWRIQKRAGLDKFMHELSEYYEIVIFCDGYMMSVGPYMEKIDPENIAHKLFRDSTLYQSGKHVKDLSRLNRPLHRTIIIDPKPDAYHLQPANAIPTKPWTGDSSDTMLVDLIPGLIDLARTPHTTDLREKLKETGANKNAEDFVSQYVKVKKNAEEQPKKSGWWSFGR